ncbi:MAG: helix-turn-helix domain-containing protein [Dehalococcoidales bacterium]
MSMDNRNWSFLTSHGVVFAYIAQNPRSTMQKIAEVTDLSIRGVSIIIDNLAKSGFLTKVKEGRCNYYIVHPEATMREDVIGEVTIGQMLKAYNCEVEEVENNGLPCCNGN